jgi:hypothetical protein
MLRSTQRIASPFGRSIVLPLQTGRCQATVRWYPLDDRATGRRKPSGGMALAAFRATRIGIAGAPVGGSERVAP